MHFTTFWDPHHPLRVVMKPLKLNTQTNKITSKMWQNKIWVYIIPYKIYSISMLLKMLIYWILLLFPLRIFSRGTMPCLLLILEFIWVCSMANSRHSWIRLRYLLQSSFSFCLSFMALHCVLGIEEKLRLQDTCHRMILKGKTMMKRKKFKLSKQH